MLSRPKKTKTAGNYVVGPCCCQRDRPPFPTCASFHCLEEYAQSLLPNRKREQATTSTFFPFRQTLLSKPSTFLPSFPQNKHLPYRSHPVNVIAIKAHSLLLITNPRLRAHSTYDFLHPRPPLNRTCTNDSTRGTYQKYLNNHFTTTAWRIIQPTEHSLKDSYELTTSFVTS